MAVRDVVRRGEYLERAVVIPGDPPLEGLFHRGTRRPLVLAPPYPSRGGGMESPIIAEIAWALTRAGHATLRFNYPGIGASAGRFAPGAPEASVARALVHASECAPGLEPAAVGVGLGGNVLLRHLLGTEAGPVVLVMPDLEPSRPDLSVHAGEVWIVVAQHTPAEHIADLESWVERAPRGGVRRVPGADPSFLRGLATLGRVVVDLFHPPGEVDLDLEG